MASSSLLAGAGSAAGGAAALIPAIFGTTGSQTGRGSGTSTTTGTTREKLTLDQDAINKIIEDVLGGAGGLAEIFAGEQTAGIFDSTSAASAAGDLASKLVGELAKLTAERETVQEQETEQSSFTKSRQKTGGLLGTLKSFF